MGCPKPWVLCRAGGGGGFSGRPLRNVVRPRRKDHEYKVLSPLAPCGGRFPEIRLEICVVVETAICVVVEISPEICLL